MKISLDFVQKMRIPDNDGRVSGNEPYYALEVTADRLYSFDLDGRKMERELLKLKTQIENILGYDNLAHVDGITKEDMESIIEYHATSKGCSRCELKYDACYDCVLKYTDPVERYVFKEHTVRNLEKSHFDKDVETINKTFETCERASGYCKYWLDKRYDCALVCQSPLERTFYLGTLKHGLPVNLQVRINKDGTRYDHPQPVDRSNILTIPDFYLESGDKKVCIYVDGFNYHERTEEQAIRDRNIDRELQRMKYLVMRYTTKDVNNRLDQIVWDLQAM